MRLIFCILLLISFNLNGQNKFELYILNHAGKLNLAPRYGFGLINKDDNLIDIDNKFIDDVTKQFGSKDSACKVYNQMGWNYFYRGDLRTAMKRFNQAWILDSTNAGEYFGFCAILNIIKDKPNAFFETSSGQINEIDNPVKYYNIGLEKDKYNIEEKKSLLILAYSYEQYDKLELAIQSCNRFLDLSPNYTNILNQRGHLFTINKEWQKAILDLNQAILNGSQEAYSYNDLGYAYDQIGEFDKANLNYKKSAELKPDFLNPIYNNVLLHIKMGDLDKAIDLINKCIQINDGVAQFYKTKGEILIKQNLKAEGMKNLKKAVKLGDKEAQQIIKENKN